jgi:DNA topoisomerase-1
VDDLVDLDGLGERTAEKLADVEIESLEDLQRVDADEVATDLQGVSADQIREWQSQLGAEAAGD